MPKRCIGFEVSEMCDLRSVEEKLARYRKVLEDWVREA